VTPELKQLLAKAKAEGWADWIRGPADHHAMLNGCYFDLAAAEAARDFFPRYLRHTVDKWAGTPFTLLDWQYRNVIGPLFGWRNADGSRRFTKCYFSTAKKQGKTTLYAGLAIYLLLTTGAGTEIYSAGADREQASLIYKEASSMVRANPALARRIRCKDSTKTLIGRGRDFYRALSADANTKEGINASVVLADELHAWPGRQLYDALNYAGSARTNPLFLIITTAGDDLESICGEEYQRAKRWLAGDYIDDSYFAFIAEAASEDDWTKEETWRKANPSYGITVPAAKFKADFIEAQDSPAKEAAFRRYRLNQWVSVANAWLSMEQWDKLDHTLDPKTLEGRECYAGLDLSATDDTTALILLFPNDDGSISLIPRFWLPQDNIVGLGKKHRVSYQAWAKSGYMTLTPGNVVDYAAVRQDIRDLSSHFKIKKLAIDRKFQGMQLELDLIADGFPVEPAGQGWISQDLPAKELEKLIKSGQIHTTGNPILRWHMSNAVVDIDKADNYSLNKKKARSKIDGVAATLMALLCKMRQPAGASDTNSKPWTGELIVM